MAEGVGEGAYVSFAFVGAVDVVGAVVGVMSWIILYLSRVIGTVKEGVGEGSEISFAIVGAMNGAMSRTVVCFLRVT